MNGYLPFRKRLHPCLLLLPLLLNCGPVVAQDDGVTQVSARVRALMQESCADCHGPELAESGFQIELAPSSLQLPSGYARWRQIIQRIEAGEMPPAGSDRPDPQRLAGVLAEIRQGLAEADRLRAETGRVTLRRLNRTEYENTVRRLFSSSVEVRQLLPEDPISHGFDTVGAALSLSAVQLERYLEAADQVLADALKPVHEESLQVQRFDLYDSLPQWFLPGVWKQDEGVILFRNGGSSATDLREFKASAPGLYTFRIAASAWQSETPLLMGIALGNFVVAGNPTRHLGYFDAFPGEPRVLEFTERLERRNDTIKVTPVHLPFVYLKHETMPEYPGPGLQIHWMEVAGPHPEEWPTESFRAVFADVDPATGTIADAGRLLREFLPRAFRRPVRTGEEQPFLDVVEAAMANGSSFRDSYLMALKAVLVSPDFLYLREPNGRLDAHALASRLSYFLWSAPPDAALSAAADSGELLEPEVLHQHVERMLESPHAKQFTKNFFGQWLSLRDIAATTPDPMLYPEFDESLQWSAVLETELFMEEMLRSDLGISSLVKSDFSIVNGRLAEHYGIPDVHGVEFRKVQLSSASHRGGVLTQAAILKVTANGTNTSPVIRGVWVLDRILGQPPLPPPAGVPAVEPDIRGATTIREQLEKHRADAGCRGCHARIDPPGFALESFDVIGGFRSQYRVVAEQNKWVKNRVGPLARFLAAWQYGLGPDVECSGELLDGRKFAEIDEYRDLLLADTRQIARNVAGRLVTYGTGSPVSFGDWQEIDRILDSTADTDYGLRSLIHAVVASELFLNK